MTQYGTYREVDGPRRLVYTERFVDQSFTGGSLIATVLEERDGRTTLRTTVRLPSAAARDLVLSRPMERGLGEGFERLDEVVAAQRARHEGQARPANALGQSDDDTDARSRS